MLVKEIFSFKSTHSNYTLSRQTETVAPINTGLTLLESCRGSLRT